MAYTSLAPVWVVSPPDYGMGLACPTYTDDDVDICTESTAVGEVCWFGSGQFTTSCNPKQFEACCLRENPLYTTTSNTCVSGNWWLYVRVEDADFISVAALQPRLPPSPRRDHLALPL